MQSTSAKSKDDMTEATLGLLSSLQHDSMPTQRSLATKLGIALGLTNALIKRCVRKGLIKVRQAPAKRYAYYLTPSGFREKSRLTAEYLSNSLSFYRIAREEYSALFDMCAKNGWNRVAVVGASELSEIAHIASQESGLPIAAVLEPGRNSKEFIGLKVITEYAGLKDFDAVIISQTTDPQDCYRQIAMHVPSDRILAPSFLHLVRDEEASQNDSGLETAS